MKEFYDEKFSKEYGTDAVYLSLDPQHYHQKILERVGNNQVILDVGCATGYLGAVMKQKGNRVYGIEISDVAAKKAMKVLDDVIVGNIENIDLPFPKKYFDKIICSDVLEHLFNPRQVLFKLRDYLKPTGELMVVVPNVAYYTIRLMLLMGNWEYRDVGSMDYGHLRFFTKKTISILMEKSGYHVLETISYLALPFPLSLLRYPSGKVPSRVSKSIEGLFAQSFLFVAKVT
jgi:2-polyprenyl-3-methyl-5-hydroxy-6-metoxy-1,4-benzoquinol methylase